MNRRDFILGLVGAVAAGELVERLPPAPAIDTAHTTATPLELASQIEESREFMCAAWRSGDEVWLEYPYRPEDNVVIALDPHTGRELGRRYLGRGSA